MSLLILLIVDWGGALRCRRAQISLVMRARCLVKSSLYRMPSVMPDIVLNALHLSDPHNNLWFPSNLHFTAMQVLREVKDIHSLIHGLCFEGQALL